MTVGVRGAILSSQPAGWIVALVLLLGAGVQAQQLGPASNGSLPTALDEAVMVLHAGGRAWLVFDRDGAWAADSVVPESLERGETALAPTDPAALPAELADLAGREVALFGPTGLACSGALAAPVVLARHAPQHSERLAWAGDTDWDGEVDGPPASDEQVAADVYVEGHRLLVAEVTATQGDCSVALWARAVSAPAPAVYLEVELEASLAERVRAAFSALGQHQALQEELVEALADLPAEEQAEHPTDRAPEVYAFRDSAAGRTLVLATVRHGWQCAPVWFELTGLWEVTQDGSLELVTVERTYIRPAAVFDGDGDGTVEFITADGTLLRRNEARYQAVLTLRLFACC
jgi:hypothetical protein